MARCLADAGCSVVVTERRAQVGGNAYDFVHESGIRVHQYGPHYFRTSAPSVWRFMNRFARFHKYEAEVKCRIDGAVEDWPVNEAYVRRIAGEDWRPGFSGIPTNFEEAALKMIPRPVYEKAVCGYSTKQWGVPPRDLSVDLAGRLEVRGGNDRRLTPWARYQGVPRGGYTRMVERMLEATDVVCGFDYTQNREAFRPKRLTIYTGSIDEFFEYCLGTLKFRAQRREVRCLSSVSAHQEAVQVNEPSLDAGPHIRTIEWKHLPQDGAFSSTVTVITVETPTTATSADSREYPFPDAANRGLFHRYRALACSVGDVLICGRLGDYRYYDMDHVVYRALSAARMVLGGHPPSEIYARGSVAPGMRTKPRRIV
jgi:UDP-galactopyranose mutase